MVKKEYWRKMIKRYKKALQRHGSSIRALKWKSESAMLVRHEELLKDLDMKDKTLLDVGCGFGDILNNPKLSTPNQKLNYLGVDIIKEFVEIARKKHPGYKFSVRNYFEKPFKRNFDIILCSGALNSNFGKETIKFRKKAIKTMFDHCNYALSFNMAGSTPQPKNKKGEAVYYANSLEILRFCLSLTKKIIFRHHYRPHDFTILMFK